MAETKPSFYGGFQVLHYLALQKPADLTRHLLPCILHAAILKLKEEGKSVLFCNNTNSETYGLSGLANQHIIIKNKLLFSSLEFIQPCLYEAHDAILDTPSVT